MISATLVIAITLIAGAATWSFARSQAAASENALASNYLTTNNFLNERFEVTDMYFSSSTQVTFWLYNIGVLTYSPFSVRVYDSAGLVNIQFNYTSRSGTDNVYDLRATVASKCKAASASWESPTMSTMTLKSTNQATVALTIPPAAQGGCTAAQDPSYGQTFNSGTTYTVVVTGLYGNVYTYAQVK